MAIIFVWIFIFIRRFHVKINFILSLIKVNYVSIIFLIEELIILCLNGKDKEQDKEQSAVLN